MNKLLASLGIAFGLILGLDAATALGQGYGTDNQNVLTPASGGMAGVSLALPQDVPSAIFGNPATLAQFQGTQFTMGGAWAEGYPTVSYDGRGSLAGGPFTVTSRTEGLVAPAIGVTQDLRSLGLQGTIGMGFSGLSGLGAEYRGLRPPEVTPMTSAASISSWG